MLIRPMIALTILGLPALQAQVVAQASRPTPAAALRFMHTAESTLAVLSIKVNQAQWVQQNFITEDTEALSAEAQSNFGIAVQRLAMAARRYDALRLSAELRRKFLLLKLSLAAPPPADPAEANELTRITVSMDADYGRGTYCRPGSRGAARRLAGMAPGRRPDAEPLPALRRTGQQGFARHGIPRRRGDVAGRL
jgi:peptidyl-dipeptidase A